MSRKSLGITIIFLLVIFLTACGNPAEPTQLPVDSGGVVIPQAKPGDPCKNEYFPLKEKAKYTYSSTGSTSGPYRFVKSIRNIKTDEFAIRTKLKGRNIIQKWSCKPEGLVPSQLGINDVTSILAFEKFTDLTATNITGFVLPPVISSGAEWNYALDIQGKETVTEATPGAMTGHVAMNYIAGKEESVTVPAGTFDAIAIEVRTVIHFKVVTGDNLDKLSVASTYTVWYAPGIGWVKSSGYGKVGGQDYVETIVLESYTIP